MITSSKYSNKTLYGIEDQALRCTWASYIIFVLLSSLIGDTTILIASIKYRAFKLHKYMVIIIEHIAICDLLVTITAVIPITTSLFADIWILGEFLCYTLPYASYFSSVAGLLLICAMTSSKLLILRYPIEARIWPSKTAHLICGTAWTTALVLPLMFFLVDKNDISFDYRHIFCDYLFSSNIWNWLIPLFSVLYLVIPNCIVISTTLILLIIAKKIARRSRENLRWEGVITTVLTATVYCISVMPYAIYRIADEINIESLQDPQGFFHKVYFRIARSLLYLNTISNFYIYCLTVSSFRKFLWSRIKLLRITCNKYGKYQACVHIQFQETNISVTLSVYSRK